LLITSFKSTYSRPKLIFGLLASVVMSTGLFLAQVQPGTIDIDGGIFSAVAFKDLHGGTLYLDAWENKPPGIFYLMEFFYLLVPDDIYALFVMGLLAMTGFALCLFYLFYRYLESLLTALLCIGVALYFTIYPNNIGDGLYTEIYGTLCLVGSLVFFERYRINPSALKLVLTGILAGTSYWFKEPFILPFAALMAYYAYLLNNRDEILKLLLSSIIPSLIFFLLLWSGGSLKAFIDTFLYNFHYTSGGVSNNYPLKFSDFFHNLIEPVFGLSLLLIYIIFKNISDKRTRNEAMIWLMIWISAAFFVFISPYNLGHYYFPAFVLFFILLAKQFALFKSVQYPLTLPLIILLVYYIFQIDKTAEPNFKYHITAYQPDNISKRILADKNATLFVDYVSVGNYYIKTQKNHHAFLPVGLRVHFDTSETGRNNTARIWKDLSVKPPDYLITTFTTAYFSWHLPDTKFYEKNYEKIDSVFPENEHVIYLWAYKNRLK
jgi:hypothetical protein